MPQDPFYSPLPAPKVYADGIFKGGGTAGIAYVGALQALARNEIWFKRVAGTSAGAITAATIAAGYDANVCDFLAAPSGVRSGPPDNAPPGSAPIDYSALLDLPLSPGEVTLQSRRGNLIYKAIEGCTIDELLQLSATLPSLDPFVDRIVAAILSALPTKVGPFRVTVGPFDLSVGPFGVTVLNQHVQVGPFDVKTPQFVVEVGPFPFAPPQLKRLIRNAVELVLSGYPKLLKLADSGLFPTQQLREQFADAVMAALLLIPVSGQLLVIYLNFMGDGGLFKGDKFLSTMRGILQSALRKSPVLFSDLTLNFACLATDITAREVQIFSKDTTPTAEVAEAVRRSMSIPFIFEPRRDNSHEVMDGGIIDNFPVGFFLAQNNYVTNTDDDMKRIKIALAPGTLGFGSPTDLGKTLATLIPGSGALPNDLVEGACLNRLVNVALSNMQQSPLLDAMLEQYRAAANYYQIGIDSGHSATDFFISAADFKDMAAKGWDKAIPIVEEILAPNSPLQTVNPYV
jgi:predicted acylesterase/phospholipase RssA